MPHVFSHVKSTKCKAAKCLIHDWLTYPGHFFRWTTVPDGHPFTRWDPLRSLMIWTFRVALLGGDLINIQPTCCCHHLWSIRLLRVAVFGERGIDGAHFILRISQLPSGLMTPGLPSGWSHRVKIPRHSWIISTNSYCCYEFLRSKPGIQ